MAENMGGIVYTVDMDTAAVTKGADRVNAALDSVGKGADKLDTSMVRTGASMSKTAKATDEEAAALRKLLGQIDPTVAATQRLDQMTEDLGKAFDKGQISAKDYAANLAKLDSQYNKLAGSTDKATASTKKADSASSGFTTSLTPLAAAIAGVITAQTLAQWGKLAEQFTILQVRIARLSPDLETARQTYQSLLAIAAQTGSSMQNTAKLWEGLTSTLKDLGATNSQVLALTGTLQKIGAIGGSSADEIARGLRQLQQGLAAGTLRAEEFNSVVENTPELARQLAKGFGMSMGQLRQAMLDGKISAQALFDVLINGTQNVDVEFAKLPRTVTMAANAVTVQFGAALSVIDQALGASQKLAAALDGIARGIQMTFNPTEQEQFNKLLRDRATAQQQYETQLASGLRTTAAATKTRLDGLNAEIKKMQEARVAALKANAAPGGTSAGKPAATTTTDGQKALEQLAEQNQQLRAQGVERAKIIALQKLGAGATQAEKDAAVALAVENYKLTEAEKQGKKDATAATVAKRKAEAQAAQAQRKEETERKRAEEQAKRGAEQNQKVFADLGSQLAQVGKTAREVFQDQAELSLNGKFATPDQVQRVRDLAGALYDARNAKQALAAADPIAGAQINFDQEMQQLQALNDQKLLSDERYLELKGQAERAHLEEMRALQEENFRQASLGNQLLIDSLNSLASSGTQAISGLLSGTMSLKEAMGGIANTVLNSVVGAFVQMGVDWVKQQIIMQSAAAATTGTQVAGTAAVTAAQTAATGTIAATTTAAAATTGAAVSTSMAPAAGLSSIASFGGAAVIGGAALLATMLLAKSFGGGRQYGGAVAGNKMYRVNEGGAPEIFNAAGGKQYMMPNTRGEVVSNKDATAGGAGGTTVNVHNYAAGAEASVSKSQGLDGREVIDIVVQDLANGGRSARMVHQITGTKRSGS